MRLTKTEIVLRLDGIQTVAPTFVPFFVGEDTFVTLDSETWVDMGRPDSITVTIEPGNKL